MSTKNAIITLIFIMLLIGVFFLYLYYTNKLALKLSEERVKPEEQTEQLTPTEKKQIIADALKRMKENEDSQLSPEEKQQQITDALERMEKNDDSQLSQEEKGQLIKDALKRMDENQD